jgi:hypothetical protein
MLWRGVRYLRVGENAKAHQATVRNVGSNALSGGLCGSLDCGPVVAGGGKAFDHVMHNIREYSMPQCGALQKKCAPSNKEW